MEQWYYHQIAARFRRQTGEHSPRKFHLKTILFWGIYLLAVSLRLYQLSATTVYPDEVTWMVKGKETVYALKSFNLDYFRQAWWNDREDSYAISWPLVTLSGLSHVLFAGAGKYSLHLFSDIVASRLPLVLVGSFLAPAIFYFGIQFFTLPVALFASLAYAVNPLSIALDRWLVNDSFLALFSFLSVAGFLSAAKSKRMSVKPGFWLALAFLTKPNGILGGLTWLVLFLFDKAKTTRRLFWLNTLAFFGWVTLLWPQSWFRPLLAIPEYLINQAFLVNHGDPIHNFYLGSTTDSPHWSYYLFQVAFRTPEIIVLAALGAMVYFFSRFTKFKRQPRLFIAAVAISLLVNLLFLSTSSVKGGVRYILFLYPWIYLAAAFFLYHLVRPKKLLLLCFPFLIYPLLYHPQYYLYYNLFIGGPVKAARYDLVGLCFGNQAALRYLDQKQVPGKVAVLGCADAAPYHTNRTLTKDLNTADLIILETAFVQQFPQHPEVLKLLKKTPLAIITEKGIITARIYH